MFSASRTGQNLSIFEPMRAWSNTLFCIAATVAGAQPALAQLPGESVFAGKANIRAEFLAKTFEDVRRSLTDWNAAVNQHELKAFKDLVAPDLFLGPIEGWLAQGPEALDSLASYFPRMAGYSASPIDFDASGSIAYVYAAVRYQFTTPKGRDYRDVEATIVLVQRGDVWKVRSYVERQRADGRSP